MLPVVYSTALPLQLYIVQASNDSAEDTARHGQNQEEGKNTATYDLKFFSSENFFRWETKTVSVLCTFDKTRRWLFARETFEVCGTLMLFKRGHFHLDVSLSWSYSHGYGYIYKVIVGKIMNGGRKARSHERPMVRS